MSYAAIDWAMPKVIKDVNAKSCLVVLAYHHNKETGLCCPSISTIADEMGVRSLNTVRKAIGVLVEMNLLTMSREFGDRGEILSTRYTLNLQSEAFKPVRKKKGVVHDVKEGHEVKEVHDVKEGGSPNEGGVVHLVQGGSSSHEGGVVHVVNPNKEVEQGKEQITGTEKETSNSLPAQAPWETDHLTNDGKKVEKPKKTVDRGSRLSITELPDDWKAFAEQEEPDLDPKRLFENFKDYWNGLSGAKAIKKDWKGTWRNFVRSFHNAEDWKRRPMLKRAPTHSPSRPGQFVEKKQSERDYFDW
nr:MAG TPA: helix-turn-helix domain protein [Caudoviricetes sp.]